MIYRQLIAAGKRHLRQVQGAPGPVPVPGLNNLFPFGARWMYDRLQELHPSDDRPFNPAINYTGYGLFKYGCCLIGAILPGLSSHSRLFIPLSIGIFYLLEVHFLFMFPLLIDGTPQPLRTSIRAAYKIGLGQCLITVIPMACYMMIGLLRKKDPFRNWYIGCLAIVIWYEHDIRNRL